ncbi:DUF748 domain-containing protein [Piscinibacter sakaiensis]|uniref:DUF748 domain-containing protein n=1 Tax=Piscinibacter sakaiensis TaxID=1547922 RepID=UPI00372968C8
MLEAVTVDGPVLRLTRLADGRYDIDDLIARFAAPSAPPAAGAEPLRFALHNLRVSGGRVRVLDAITLGLPALSNLPAAVALQVEPRLAFRLGDTTFDTGAQATPFAATRRATLQLRMAPLDLKPFLPYLPADLPLRPSAGRARGRRPHRLARRGRPPRGRAVAGIAEPGPRGAALAERRPRAADAGRGRGPVGRAGRALAHRGPRDAAGGRRAEPRGRRAAAPAITLREATLASFYARLVVSEQGRFNLQDLGASPAAAAASGAAASGAAGTAGTRRRRRPRRRRQPRRR